MADELTKNEVSPDPVSVGDLLSGSAEQVQAVSAPLEPVMIDSFVAVEMAKAQRSGHWLFMVARVEGGQIHAEWKTESYPSEDIVPAIDLLRAKLKGQIAGPEVVDLPQADPLQVQRVEDFLPEGVKLD